jgi:hypothetical protein
MSLSLDLLTAVVAGDLGAAAQVVGASPPGVPAAGVWHEPAQQVERADEG